MGKAAPCNYFRKYPGRFEMLHIKDVTEVGQSGFVGFDAIFKNADVAGLKHYIVEMEASGVGDILETCRISADYLKEADFVKPSYAE
jgi:sugar phosphate isomerase/epimerase